MLSAQEVERVEGQCILWSLVRYLVEEREGEIEEAPRYLDLYVARTDRPILIRFVV